MLSWAIMACYSLKGGRGPRTPPLVLGNSWARPRPCRSIDYI
jgi:hypothetical protein